MLPIELPPLESGNRLVQLPTPVAHAEHRPTTAPNPSSGYIIAVG